MDTDTVAKALELIDSVLAKVACTRNDHRRLREAVDIVSDAAFGILDDKE